VSGKTGGGDGDIEERKKTKLEDTRKKEIKKIGGKKTVRFTMPSIGTLKDD